MRYANYHGIHQFIIICLAISIIACDRDEPNTGMPPPSETGLKLSEAQMQLANIKVEYVTSGVISHQLLLTGALKVDEQSVYSINARSRGRIQKLHIKNTGVQVNIGDPLYDFYSEELLAVAREYQGLHDNNWSTNLRPDLEIDARNRLLLKGILPSQIDDLNKSRYIYPVFTIYSTGKGIIRSINVSEGEYVETGQNLYELADNSKIWVEAQVYPNELRLLEAGIPAEVIIPAAGNLCIPEKISYINPAFVPGSNITIVRVVIDNPGKRLKPGMLALLRISTIRGEGIVIPSSALLMGKSGYIVWIQQEDGTFVSREVVLDIKSADSVLVLSGIEEYEGVVVSGAYLLNSEKILKKSYAETSQ